MIANCAIVWVFDSHTEAEARIKELQGHRFDMKNLSIVGNACHASGASKETN